jgi:hypothetical protein
VAADSINPNANNQNWDAKYSQWTMPAAAILAARIQKSLNMGRIISVTFVRIHKKKIDNHSPFRNGQVSVPGSTTAPNYANAPSVVAS